MNWIACCTRRGGAARLGERAHLSQVLLWVFAPRPLPPVSADPCRDHRVLCRRVPKISGIGGGWCWGELLRILSASLHTFSLSNLPASPRGATLLPKPDHILLLALGGTDWRVGQLGRLVYRNHKSIGLHLIWFKINPKEKKRVCSGAARLWGARGVY